MINSTVFLRILNDYINSYLKYAKGLSDNTVKSYKYAFRLLIEYMYTKKGIAAENITFDMLTFDQLSEFLDWLEQERGCSTSTKNQRLAALSSFSSYAQNRDMDAAAVFRASITKIPAKKCKKKKRAVFTIPEVSILLRLPGEHRRTGLRDKVLLSTMYATGARGDEICNICVKDIRFTNKGATVALHGKGNKLRNVGISQRCARTLQDYICYRRIQNQPDRHVFSSQTHERMTVSCIEEIFKKYVLKAKAEHPDMFREQSYPPHSMRHSSASHMLESGVPLVVIKNILGHSSLITTQIYAEISQDTVDKHLREWNEKWFGSELLGEHKKTDAIPEFLDV